MRWLPLSEAPKDGSSVLAFLPFYSHDITSKGIYALRWSGWGGGVWELGNGARPLEHEMLGAIWTPLEPIVISARTARND